MNKDYEWKNVPLTLKRSFRSVIDAYPDWETICVYGSGSGSVTMVLRRLKNANS